MGTTGAFFIDGASLEAPDAEMESPDEVLRGMLERGRNGPFDFGASPLFPALASAPGSPRYVQSTLDGFVVPPAGIIPTRAQSPISLSAGSDSDDAPGDAAMASFVHGPRGARNGHTSFNLPPPPLDIAAPRDGSDRYAPVYPSHLFGGEAGQIGDWPVLRLHRADDIRAILRAEEGHERFHQFMWCDEEHLREWRDAYSASVARGEMHQVLYPVALRSVQRIEHNFALLFPYYCYFNAFAALVMLENDTVVAVFAGEHRVRFVKIGAFRSFWGNLARKTSGGSDEEEGAEAGQNRGGKRKRVLGISDRWLESPYQRRYHCVDFDPVPPGTQPLYQIGMLNLFRGWPFGSQLAGDTTGAGCPRFMQHLRTAIARGDETIVHALLGFFAHLIQRPFEKPQWAVLLVGDQGTGKNSLIYYVAHMLGLDYLFTQSANVKDLFGDFNGLLRNKLLVAVNEFDWRGIIAAGMEAKLKDLITEPLCTINEKFLPRVQMKSFARVIFAANPPRTGGPVVGLNEGDRRFYVVETSEQALAADTVAALKAECHSGGAASLFRFLAHYDLSAHDFSPFRLPPSTDARLKQQILSLSNVQRAFGRLIVRGENFFGEWCTELPFTEFEHLMDERLGGHVLRTNLFGLMPEVECTRRPTWHLIFRRRAEDGGWKPCIRCLEAFQEWKTGGAYMAAREEHAKAVAAGLVRLEQQREARIQDLYLSYLKDWQRLQAEGRVAGEPTRKPEDEFFQSKVPRATEEALGLKAPQVRDFRFTAVEAVASLVQARSKEECAALREKHRCKCVDGLPPLFSFDQTHARETKVIKFFPLEETRQKFARRFGWLRDEPAVQAKLWALLAN